MVVSSNRRASGVESEGGVDLIWQIATDKISPSDNNSERAAGQGCGRVGGEGSSARRGWQHCIHHPDLAADAPWWIGAYDVRNVTYLPYTRTPFYF